MALRSGAALILLVLTSLFAIAPTTQAADSDERRLLLHGDRHSAEPIGSMRVLVDLHGQLSASQALDAFAAQRGQSIERWPPTFGFADGVHWFHFHVRNQDHPDPRWLLVIDYSLLDYLDLYVGNGRGVMQHQAGGDRLGFSARRFPHRHFNFALDLPPGQDREILLRVSTVSSVQVPLRLETERHFLASGQTSQIELGIYYGLLLGLFAYNLLLFLSTRDRSFLYYVLYVGLFGLGQFNLNGLSFQYLWPGSPEWDDLILILIIPATLLAILLFTRRFLELKKRSPWALLAINALIVGQALMLLSAPFFGYRLAIRIETASVFLVAIVAIASSLAAWRSKLGAAKYYLLAWSFMLAGIVVYASVSFGLLPKNFFTEYGILIGSAAEMLLLSFALAYRINELRREHEALQHEYAVRLEVRVDERTTELNQALTELQGANRRLREYSQRDGLTGVHNRYFLDETLERGLRVATERGEAFSLLMVDIDHFKPINDNFGHLVGDSCLVSVAAKLKSCIREADDFVARFGGEEFAILLPGADLAAAAARAERIRAGIAAMTIEAGERRIHLTVSIGVVCLPPGASGKSRELLHCADQALYRAKDSGRNRVVLFDWASSEDRRQKTEDRGQ
ncbi:MAG: diguanylate cyclase [Lysobacterales bacterium]